MPLDLRRCGSTIAFPLLGALPGGVPPIAPPPAPEHVVVAPLAGRSGAYLTLSDPASRLDVTLSALPGQLFRVSTASDSGLAPAASVHGGHADIRLRPTGNSGPDAVRVWLNRDVRWDLRVAGGSGEIGLDLTGGRVRRVETGGSGLLDATLPAAGGPTALTVTGGTGSARIHTAAPLRAARPGTRLIGGRYTITFRAGVGSLAVTRR